MLPSKSSLTNEDSLASSASLLLLIASSTAEASLATSVTDHQHQSNHEPIFCVFNSGELLQPPSQQSQIRTPSCWDKEQVHLWLADKQYRELLEEQKWDGRLLVLALAHPTTFLHFMGANAVKFFRDLETLFTSEVNGHGGSIIRARRNDSEPRGGSMTTWTVAQVEAILRDKQYARKLRGLQWNGRHLDAALRFPGAFLGFMGADGICFWRDLVMLAHGPPADEAWFAGR
jgi:hypothetical protein